LSPDLVARLGDRVRKDVPLAPFTTFRVGGPAEWLFEAKDPDELVDALAVASQLRLPVTILGGGSNVLIGDGGIRGLVVRPRFAGIQLARAGRVRAEAGATINGLVRWTINHGLSGLEAWAGTPGTVGGAMFGNAHFQGRLIGELVDRVRLVTVGGDAEELPASAMEFEYDRSRLQRTGEVLLWADFIVGESDPVRLRETARASLAYRKRTQPLDTPSAGCIFQNPDPVHDQVPAGVPASAGALIDRAGLKGHAEGGASISDVHANFFVNHGSATARDIRSLIETSKTRVKERFGIDLREEIVYLGEF
jgi:UDP-N-acetylmuramate dehydrogenase